MIEWDPFSLSLSDPLKTGSGTIAEREGFVVRVAVESGDDLVIGTGEATPLAGWTESIGACRSALKEAVREAAGSDVETTIAGIDADETPAARHGLSEAFLDARARAGEQPLCQGIGRDGCSLRANATLDGGSVADVVERAREHVTDGFDCLKLKVGGADIHHDLAVTEAVHDAVGDEVTIRLDANGNWSRETAERVLSAAGDVIDVLEQPLPPSDLAGHAALSEDVSIALDESVHQCGLEAIVNADAADAVVLKPMACGGIDLARDLALRARSDGMDPIVSTTIDAVLGRSGAAHLAASLPGGERVAHGLATGHRLASDLAADPLDWRSGRVRIPSAVGRPGHGVVGLGERPSRSKTAWPPRDLLRHRRAATPDRTAIVDAEDGSTLSFEALDTKASAIAERLRSISDDGRTGILLDTRPAFVVTLAAAMRSGQAPVLFPPRAPPDRLGRMVDRAAIETIVCGAESESLAVDATADSIPLLSVDSPTAQRVDPLADPDESRNGGTATDRSDEAGPTNPLVCFTSGTTGEPKGVRLPTRALVSSAVAAASRLGVHPDDRWLCCLPMDHVGGLMTAIRSFCTGTTLVLQTGFDTTATAHAIDANDVTGLSLVPTMVTRLLDDGWRPPDHLRTVLLGGGPISEELIDRCLDRDVPICPTYGLTETTAGIATARTGEVASNPGTVGRPHLFSTVDIVDPYQDGTRDSVETELDPGETGEIRVSGPTVTPGYLDSGRTQSAFDANGRLRTGDLGHRDTHGRLWIDGRLDDAISTGGETVAPRRVADVLRSLTGVTEAVVVGIEDREWGERVGALIVPESGADVDLSAIDEECHSRLADHECPRTIVVAETLPRTASGTVDREAVRDRLRSEGVPF